jgi:hypothetical protein
MIIDSAVVRSMERLPSSKNSIVNLLRSSHRSDPGCEWRSDAATPFPRLDMKKLALEKTATAMRTAMPVTAAVI